MLKQLPAWIFALGLLANSTHVRADADPASIDSQSLNELLQSSQPIEDLNQIPALTEALWAKYQQTVRADPIRLKEQADRSIPYKDKVMRFSFAKKGEAPAQGYPLYIALHGGGTAPASLNDSQWEAMKTYYQGSVNSGIYVATRGVTNTWNLHFVDESFPLYDRLIENLIALENVDPNRVYILGFSAGGDGVYQIAPRMADRWAAANMSAGHHNWIPFDNLYRLPFLLQVGQNDSAYERNKVAVQNSIELNRLQALRGGYTHDVYVHVNGSHNSWRDNDAGRNLQPVLAEPEAWLKGGTSGSKKLNSNAIDWISQYQRDARPLSLYWDPAVDAKERLVSSGAAYVSAAAAGQLSAPKRLFYWLDLGKAGDALPAGVIHAVVDKAQNSLQIEVPATLGTIRVLLDSSLVDLAQAITLQINGKTLSPISVQADLRTMTRTLLERGDVHYVFPAEITLVNQDGVWITKD